jgi:pyridoxamine 5'-phosphate oxidase
MEEHGPTNELSAVLTQAWRLLERGAWDPHAGMRTLVLATCGLDGLPNARTVLLWRAVRERHALYFNTDVRSPKHAELKRTPRALLVLFDEAAETQLRISVDTRIHYDAPITREGWAELPREMRRLFMTQAPPGHVAPGPTPGLPPALQRDIPPPAADAEGYRNFVVVEAIARQLDWLHFSRAGHRRAAFTWDGAAPRGAWLYP